MFASDSVPASKYFEWSSKSSRHESRVGSSARNRAAPKAAWRGPAEPVEVAHGVAAAGPDEDVPGRQVQVARPVDVGPGLPSRTASSMPVRWSRSAMPVVVLP